MFEHIVKLNDKYYIRRFEITGWCYLANYRKDYWWSETELSNCQSFNSEKEALDYWNEVKAKLKEEKRLKKIQIIKWL